MAQQTMNKKIVNMNIDVGLWRKARIKAAEDDTTLTDIVEKAVKAYVEKR